MNSKREVQWVWKRIYKPDGVNVDWNRVKIGFLEKEGNQGNGKTDEQSNRDSVGEMIYHSVFAGSVIVPINRNAGKKYICHFPFSIINLT